MEKIRSIRQVYIYIYICVSLVDLTGVIGASRVSRHARKRAILVRIPLGGRLGGEGRGGAFRRSRPLFRSLVRGKLISFIRGGDEGKVGSGGNQFLLASANGSAKFYFGRVPRKDYPYRENMEVKGASRKTVSRRRRRFQPPPPPPPPPRDRD